MEEIKDLLLRKKELFREYGEILSDMIDSEIEKLAELSEELDEAVKKLDDIDYLISLRLEEIDEGKEILEDIKNRSNRDALSPERQELFDISKEIFSMISCYPSLVEQVALKAKRLQGEAMQNIERINNEGTGTGYLKTLSTALDNGSFLNLKK